MYIDLYDYFLKVDPKTKIPRNAVWGMVFFAMLLGCAAFF